MGEKLDPEAKRLRNVSSGAYRIVSTPPGTGQRTDKPLLLKGTGMTEKLDHAVADSIASAAFSGVLPSETRGRGRLKVASDALLGGQFEKIGVLRLSSMPMQRCTLKLPRLV
jgi:hypothetical protein